MPSIALSRPTLFSGLSLALASGLLASCGHSGEIRSTPEGASVRGADGKEWGITPLALDKIPDLSGSYLDFTLRKEGFAEQRMFLELSAIDEMNVKLSPLAGDHFRTQVAESYAQPISRLIQEALIVQGHLVAKRPDRAEGVLRELLKQYPGVAALHVLQADLYFLQKKRGEGLQALRQAARLDPTEPRVRATLERLDRQ